MNPAANPLISDRNIDFLLYEVFKGGALCDLPYFSDHSKETFDMTLDSARRLARGVLFPAYKAIDETPALFKDGRITVHPKLKELYPQLVDMGLLNAMRPADDNPVSVTHSKLPC